MANVATLQAPATSRRFRSIGTAPHPRPDTPGFWASRETQCVAAFAVVFLLVNLLTATRYPFVWIDEISYADPAVNLYLGNGFTSSAWRARPFTDFWAWNVPLYPLLLYAWLQLVGFSMVAVRSMSYLYLTGGTVLLWAGIRRSGLIPTARERLLVIALIAAGYSVIFAYRSARPDCLTMLIVSGLYYAHTLKTPSRRFAGLVLFGLISPWAGLQLLPMFAVGGVLLLLYAGTKPFSSLLAIAIGALTGLVLLFVFYRSHGASEAFLESLGQQTSARLPVALSHGTFRHNNTLPKDFGFVLLSALGLTLACHQVKAGVFKMRSVLSFGLVYSLALSIALVLLGKFPTYYGWMTYIPLAVCICATLSKTPPSRDMQRLSHAFIVATIATGVGLHLTAALYDWRDRDYAKVERLVADSVNSSDWVYGDVSIYYAAKSRARQLFLPQYLPRFDNREKERIDVVIVAPEKLDSVFDVLGGDWVAGEGFTPARSGFLGTTLNAGFLSLQNYRLQVYRRRR